MAVENKRPNQEEIDYLFEGTPKLMEKQARTAISETVRIVVESGDKDRKADLLAFLNGLKTRLE